MSRPYITMSQINQRAAPKAFARGQDLYVKKAIFDTVLRGKVIEARCKASSQPDPYDVQATFDDEGVVDASCTCLYEFGGDCKHVTALLLTYLHAPDRFEARQPFADALETRDKGELVSLIRQMVKRHPDLKDLVDRPTPGKVTADKPVDLKAYRKELHRAYGREREWGRPGAETAVDSIRSAALEFAERGDWRSASSIYRMIIEECLAHLDYFYEDEEGWYAESINNVIQELDVCLSFLADDDGERQAILNCLIDFYLTDIEMDGDVGADAPDIVLRYARSQEVPALRSRIKVTLDKLQDEPYGEWAIEAYSEFLIKLELLGTADPEAVLARLCDEHLYDLLISKLLELKRVDEAIDVIREQRMQPQSLIFQLQRLYAAGYAEQAIQLAENALKNQYDHYMLEWLMNGLLLRGDTESVLRWQIEQLKVEPSITLYDALKVSAQKLDKWLQVRPSIIELLEKGKYFGLLVRIYISEELWDKAWATLPKVNGGKQTWPNDNFRLEADLAQQTLETHPEKALPTLIKIVHQAIEQRNRDSYQDAARYLVKIRDAYDSNDEFEEWEKLIAQIRGIKPRLPALLEELKKAGL